MEAFWPATLRKESIRNISIRALEALRAYFSFLLRLKKYAQAIDLANKRLIVLNEAFEMDSALFKLLAAVSILYLAIGDVVNADQTFVQIHFGFKGYIARQDIYLYLLLLFITYVRIIICHFITIITIWRLKTIII